MAATDQVVRLGAEQRDLAGQAVAAAFYGDPMYAEILPDEVTRAPVLEKTFVAVVRYAYAIGEVYTTAQVEGAACWMPPGKERVTLWRLIRTGMGLPRAILSYPPASRRRFQALGARIEKLHKELMPRPHWYLQALGVHPDHQGRGIGGRLIAPVLARAEVAGVPCYLETQSESNVAVYEHRGFRVLRDESISGIRLWMMAR